MSCQSYITTLKKIWQQRYYFPFVRQWKISQDNSKINPTYTRFQNLSHTPPPLMDFLTFKIRERTSWDKPSWAGRYNNPWQQIFCSAFLKAFEILAFNLFQRQHNPDGAPLTLSNSQKHAGLTSIPRSGTVRHNSGCGVESSITKREETLFISSTCSQNHHFSFLISL